jgi:sulfate ABC transporter permease protein CysT/sulfate ABC transporter permease protein CysW
MQKGPVDMSSPAQRVLPGFKLGLSTTLIYLMVLVLIPLGMAVWKATDLSWSEFVAAVWNERAIAAYKLTFTAAFLSAAINVVLGLVVAWTLVRYDFPGKKLFDAIVDVPFALPTAVAGLVYASLYVPNGWLGQFLCPLGFNGAYTQAGIVLVLIFTGFPFVVRAVQPVLEEIDQDTEQAASTLGASRWDVVRRVILPQLLPPALTGFTLAFARAIGEYGSVIFISANKPFESEIAPVLIVSRLEAFAYREAAAIASVLLGASFLILILINRLEQWSQPGRAPLRLKFLQPLTAWLDAPFSWIATRIPHQLMPKLLIFATVALLTILIVIPVVNVFAQAFAPGMVAYWHSLTSDPDTRHSIFLTAMIAPLAVAMNTVFGIAAAYTIARFKFPGRGLLITLIDLPFSVSPIVAGLVFVLLFGLSAPLGMWLKDHGFQVLFAPPGLVLVTAFVTFPFVARELIPVLEANGPEEEIAARSLGANAWQMFTRITLPNIKWGLIYGVLLCNARAMGEFGAIYVVSGRISGKTDTMPLRVEKLFQEYNQPAAFALASVLTMLALITLVLKVGVEGRLKEGKKAEPEA